jgi:hypothetical protein
MSNTSIYQTHKPSGGGDNLFLRLKDGESVKLRIASNPAYYEQTFDEKTSGRYAWTVWNRNESKAQVFSGGVSIFNQLADLSVEWNDPQTFDITIKRTGEMLETRYSVNPAPKSVELTKEEQAECDKIELLKAVKGWWLGEEKSEDTEEVHEFDDLPPISHEDLPDGF